MVRDKLRIRFRKLGDLRLVSHHDLMRCVERMLRRASLPFRSSEGFNPKPRMAFALSLALGIEGHAEVLELELETILPEEEVRDRLARQAPAGLEILSVRRIEPRIKGQARRVCYRLAVPTPRQEGLAARCDALLAQPHCWIERSRPEPRRLDIRPYLRDLCLVGDDLELDLWVTPNGTARPDEVLAQLGLSDLLAGGVVLRRTTLELFDESADSATAAADPAHDAAVAASPPAGE